MRLLVVEEDRTIGTALYEGLTAHRFAVDRADSAAAACDLLSVNPYDLLVLDLGAPDQGGLDAMKVLRDEGRSLPILVLAACGGVEDRVRGLNAGADDWVLKPCALAELIARIQALLRRGLATAPAVLRVADLELDPGRFEVRRAGAALELTAKEFAILEYFLRHAGELVTRTHLLDHCWDASYEGLSNLVDVHVSRLRRKLDVSGGPTLLHTVRGAGFILGVRPAAR